MKNKSAYLILILLLLVLLTIPNLVSADIGRHPSLYLEIKQNGKYISGEALVCYDSFMTAMPIEGNKDYEYIKDVIENKKYTSCSYCTEGKCHHWFYRLPTRLAVLYPSYGRSARTRYYHGEEINPVLYESDSFQLSSLNTYDYIYEAILNPDHTITLNNKTPIISGSNLISFTISLILTVILELIVAWIYISRKNLSKRILLFVLLANFISLPIMWFIIPLFLKNIILFLVISEILIFFLESYIIYFFNKQEISLKQSMILSLIINIVSFSIGGSVFSVLIMFGLI